MVAKRKKSSLTPTAKKPKGPGGVEGLFISYKEPNEEIIGPSGIEQLCHDLGLDPTDRRVLILAWLMGAKRMGFFNKDEFLLGCKTLGATSLAQLKKALPKLDAAVASPDDFHNFYTFAFQFTLTEPGQKIIDVETAAQMLQVVLPDGRFVQAFCEFLQNQTEYKKINSDQWSNFLRFSQEVRSDMSNAGDNPAWPVLLDSFVEWYSQKAANQRGA